MPTPHLVMFAVDRTLVQAMGPEAVLFSWACERALGIDTSGWLKSTPLRFPDLPNPDVVEATLLGLRHTLT
jgi:hypothetical protein